MATSLRKAVTRVCTNTRDRRRAIITTLRPGHDEDFLVFRPFGLRTSYTVPVSMCYHLAAKVAAKLFKDQQAKRPARRRRS